MPWPASGEVDIIKDFTLQIRVQRAARSVSVDRRRLDQSSISQQGDSPTFAENTMGTPGVERVVQGQACVTVVVANVNRTVDPAGSQVGAKKPCAQVAADLAERGGLGRVWGGGSSVAGVMRNAALVFKKGVDGLNHVVGDVVWSLVGVDHRR